MDQEFEKLVSRLWPLLGPIYQFTEEGVAEARTLFDAKRRKYDPWYFSHTVRFHVVGRLDELQGSSLSYSMINQAMSGIEIEYQDMQFKVFKASNGKLPAAGKSVARKAFYNRNLFGSDVEIFTPKSLAILWDIDETYAVDLQLACPLSAEQPWAPGQQRWAYPIRHPALSDTSEAAFNAIVEDIPDFERTDIEEDEDTGIEEK